MVDDSRGSVDRTLWKLLRPGVNDAVVGAILRARYTGDEGVGVDQVKNARACDDSSTVVSWGAVSSTAGFV